MSRARTFKQARIALTGDLPDKDKIPNWIKHAGGKLSTSKELDEDVTHLVISEHDWKTYKPIVQNARRRGTVYLMKYVWLIDSISINKNRLCDETQSKYTWEPNHAKRVFRKKNREQQKTNKAKKKVKAAVKATIWIDGENDPPNSPADREGGSKKVTAPKKSTAKSRSVKLKSSSTKPKEIIETGIKLDKNLLMKERDMALQNYRPYVDEHGMTYMITLIRRDVAKKVKEQHDVKAIKPFLMARPRTPSVDRSIDIVEEASSILQRFTVSDSTIPWYLDEMSEFGDSVSSDVDSTCISESRSQKNASIPTRTTLEAWDEHLPFSVYPVTQYDPDLTVEDAYGVTLERRVYVPQPFAHSLQLYESFDHNENRKLHTDVVTPTSTNVSFSSYIHSPIKHDSIATLTGNSMQSPSVKKERGYYLLHQYTRKGKGKGLPIITAVPLVPMGSSFDTAYKMFCTFFKRKTGASWESARQGSILSTNYEHGAHNLEIEAINVSARQSAFSNPQANLSDPVTLAADTTGTLGASFFNSSARTSIEQRQMFHYVPNADKDLQEISDAYAERYREKWLPSHAYHQSVAQSNGGLANDARTWAEIVTETKP